MSDLRATLAQAAAKNGELLSTLARTDHATPGLKQSLAYISDLETQIAALDKELKKLHETTEDERKDHLKYRDSTVKRFAHKLGGKKGKEKFVTKQEKEEREFLEAWQKEREATGRREELDQALEYARKEKATHESDKARHDTAQTELDQLYNAIFSGPTPEVPQEDQMESTVATSRDWYQQCQTKHGAEKQAMEAIVAADRFLTGALSDMNDAHSASTWDLWGGGTLSDMMERDALSRAQYKVTQASWHMNEACRAQPAIKPLSDVNIDMGHFISDVLFDTVFSDLAQHDRIKSSYAQLQNAAQQLKQQIRDQQQRLKDGDMQAKQASQNLEDARLELQRIRAEAFQSLAGGELSSANNGLEVGDVPPSYSA